MLSSGVRTWPIAPGSERRKPRTSANRHDDPRPKNIDRIRLRRPTGRPARSVSGRVLGRILKVAVLCALLGTAATTLAAADQAHEHFQTGRMAFERGNYAAALAEFEAAAAAGMTGPAIQFNIGVAAWKAGELERAETAFRQTALTPEMAALAHYNLGLVALKREDRGAARRWFSSAEREAQDERLRELATTQLARLPAPASTPTWVGYAVAAAGYDDNVALISTSTLPTASDVADEFLELQLALSVPFGGDWRFDAGAFAIDYRDLDAFDQLGIQAAAGYRFALGNWSNAISAELAYTTIDGEGLESSRVIAVESRRGLTALMELQARYRYYDLDGMNDFEGLTGHRHEAMCRLGWRRSAWDLGIEIQGDTGEYREEVLSATRYQVGVDARHTWPAGWTASGEVRRRHSRYDAESNGTEDFTELALTLHKTLASRWRLFVRYAYADNDATLPEFQYDRSRIVAGVDAVL